MEHLEGASAAERMLIDRASEQRMPINGSIELLPLCNMNCEMCYVRLSREEMERQGRLRTAAEWLAVARQMKDAGTLFLLLTGGEPLIYPEFKQLYTALRALGFLITINTNGTLIDEDWAAFFGQHKPRRVNITLYGADEQAYASLCHYPGGFARVTRGVRLLREQGVEVKLSVSLTPQNRDELDRLFAVGAELGVPVHVDTYMMPAERERSLPFDQQARLSPEEAARGRVRAFLLAMGPQSFLEFAARHLMLTRQMPPPELPNKMTCLAGSCSFTINWQGQMRPCVVMTSPAADVFALGFDAAWKQIRAEADGIVLSETCAACPLRALCRTCAASALLETGCYDGVPAYMCRYTKETYRLLAAFCARAAREKGEES